MPHGSVNALVAQFKEINDDSCADIAGAVPPMEFIKELLQGKIPEVTWALFGAVALWAVTRIKRLISPLLVQFGKKFWDGVIHTLTPHISQGLASRWSLKTYARLQLVDRT